MSDEVKRIAKNLERLFLTGCRGETPVLRRCTVCLEMERQAFADLVAAVEYSPRLPLPLIAALRLMMDPRIAAARARDGGSTSTVAAVMPLATFLNIAGVAIATPEPTPLWRPLGRSIAGIAERLADLAPHTAEALSMVGTQMLEAVGE